MKNKKLTLLFTFCLSALTVAADETPIMGWSSWNTYRVNISENIIKLQARTMHEKGLDKAGYRYINIDDGYFGGRDANGNLKIHPERFPNGLKPVVDYIHSFGFKAGIYSDAGRNTCGSYWDQDKAGIGVGLYGHDQQDADYFFKETGFDFIKVDFCGGDAKQNSERLSLDEETRYRDIRKAIDRTGRKEVRMNVCRWAFPGTWVHEVASSWRIDADINPSWQAVKRIIDKNLFLSAYATGGKFNDMDMMEVGRGLTTEEDKTHFGMWCILCSPLMIGCDMTTLTDETLNLLKNEELIALNQDPLALQAYVVDKQNDCYILVKDLKKRFGKQRAVAFYNPTDSEKQISIHVEHLDLDGKIHMRDLFEHQNLSPVTDGIIKVTVPAHGTRIYRLEAAKRREQVRYEAENAWLEKYSAIRTEDFARVVYDKNMSCGAYVGYLGDTEVENNFLEWKEVYSKKGGTYELTIVYASAENRDLECQINENTPVVLKDLNSGDWTKTKKTTITVELKRGLNKIKLFNTQKSAPNIDYIELNRNR